MKTNYYFIQKPLHLLPWQNVNKNVTIDTTVFFYSICVSTKYLATVR